MVTKEEWTTAEKKTPVKGITTLRIDQGNLTIVRYAFEGNSSFPLHRHPEEQTVIVLGGSCTMTTDDGVLKLKEGDLVHCKSMESHGITSGENGTVFLNIITPRRTEDRTEYLQKISIE